MSRKEDPEIETYLPVKVVADRLSVSERSVRRWIAEGTIEVVRLGRSVRISPAALRRFLADRRA